MPYLKYDGRYILPADESAHLKVLDGWRGISILSVLAAHLLPLGPKRWELNVSSGLLGMAIFFCLSGFLITSFLLRRPNIPDFLIRRMCRILPLAWLALPIGLWLGHAPAASYLPNFLFYANLPPQRLVTGTEHFWSLCVEVQFYLSIALLVALAGRPALRFLPIACLAITALRIFDGKYDSIETYHRVDEILSGATLALVYAGEFGQRARAVLLRINPWACAVLLLLSTRTGFIAYGRPYFAAALVGSSLLRPAFPFASALRGRTLAYIAEISYALYVVHPILTNTWLGTGATLVKYIKRPLLIIAIVALAHLSTFYYEHRWVDFGKRLSGRRAQPRESKERPA
jgi:peptidoglycan/LPS O-acetylase OafA/YrhL